MHRILILLAAVLTMACSEIGSDGSISAALSRPALTAAERQLVAERFGADFAQAARIGVAADALFGFGRCELNAAGPEELVVVGRSPAHCIGVDREDRPICGLWILSRTPDGWVQVLETAGTPRLSTSVSNGWRDLVVERGGPPLVFKFSAAGYREDLGGAQPVAVALDDWGGEGAADVDWYAFDDPMPPFADASFLWFYRTAIQSARIGALPDAFRIGVADLDGVEGAEVVIQGVSPDFCAPEGCRHWLLRPAAEGRAAALLGEVAGFDLRIAGTGGPGGRDLVLSDAQGLSVWRNDGAGWLRRAMPAAD